MVWLALDSIMWYQVRFRHFLVCSTDLVYILSMICVKYDFEKGQLFIKKLAIL